MGLSSWQLACLLARELVFLVLIGVTGGTALGVLVSRLWIPYFRVGSEALAESLPMPVRFTWTAMLGLHALFGVTVQIRG